MRRDLVSTVVVQGMGSAATLLAAVWIGRTLGPGQQGQFNQIKAWIELAAALAALGMPQAIYLAAQRQRLSWMTVRRVASVVGLLGLPAGVLVVAWHGSLSDGATGLCLAVAAALASTHALGRTLNLLHRATWRFHWVTAAPQLALLPLAALVVGLHGMSAVGLLLGMILIWAMSALWAWRGLSELAWPVPSATAADEWPALLRHGLPTWLSATVASASVVLLQQQAHAAAGAEGLGLFALALLLAQVPLTPLSYLLPLLLRQRVRSGAAPWTARVAWVMLPMLALAALPAMAGQWRSDLWMGDGYKGLHVLVAWLLVAAAFEAAIRLAGVDAQAESRPRHAAVADALRLGLLLLAVAAGWTRDVQALAIAWTLASGAALLLLLAVSGRWRAAA